LLSAHWDVLPTLCEIAQVASPKDVDGISMLATLLGESDSQEQHDFLYWEFFERGGKRAVRFGPWKAVQLNLHKKQRGSIEIYNLDDDLGEESDVADKHPELVAKAKEMFRESHSPSAIWKFAGE